MEKFKRNEIKKSEVLQSDTGINVSELVSILGTDAITQELFSVLNIESIQNEFINIPGARTIVNIQKKINEQFHKEDLKSKLENISLYENESFSIDFTNIENDYFNNSLGLNSLSTIPKYSTTRDFFSGLLQMDKYAQKLIDGGHKDILETNLNLLKGICNPYKRYRILHDKAENLFYLRAIISMSKYYNYDNNIAIVIGFIALYKEMKNSNVKYSVNRFEYNESFISILLESSEVRDLPSIGKVKSIVEISNDEIKREALKFSGACSIEIANKELVDNELIIKPHEIKSKILSLRHNQVPRTAFYELSNITNAKNVHNQLMDEVESIAKIKDVETIKYLVIAKVEKAKNEEVKKIRLQILQELNNTVNNIIELLTLFKKVELLAGVDLEAKDYLRFIIYQALTYGKRRTDNSE